MRLDDNLISHHQTSAPRRLCEPQGIMTLSAGYRSYPDPSGEYRFHIVVLEYIIRNVYKSL